MVFRDGASGEAAELGGMTFEGEVLVGDEREVRRLEVSAGDGVGVVRLVVPELPEGRWGYELRARGEDGEVWRVVWGHVTAVGALKGGEAREYETRTMRVMLPGGAVREMRAEWAGCMGAEMHAAAAEAAAKRAEAAAERTEAASGSVLDELETEKGRVLAEAEVQLEEVRRGCMAEVEGKQAELADLVERLLDLEGRIAAVREELRGSVFVDADSGHLIVGGLDTGAKVVGEPGKSPWVDERKVCHWWDDEAQVWRERSLVNDFVPYINARGYWVGQDKATGQEYETEFRAVGRDGLDGRSVVRHVVGSVEELPREGEECSGGHLFYVGREDGWFDVYAWLVGADGEGDWVRVCLEDDLATAERYGLVRLGTDVPVADGAPVGAAGDGGLEVPLAEFTVPGVGRVSVEETLVSGSGVGMTADGRFVGRLASVEEPGAVRLSFAGEAEAGCVGLMANGALGLPWGRPGMAGALLVGERATSSLDARFLVDVGVTDDHLLRVQLDPNGALEFVGGGYLGGVEGVNQTEKFLRLRVNGSVLVDEDGALGLRAADEARLGGVRLGRMGMPEPGTVPSTEEMSEWLKDYALAEDVLSREGADEQVGKMVDEKMGEYARKADVNGLASMTWAEEKFQPKGGVPVYAYDDVNEYPAVEDQLPGVLYIGPTRAK